MMTKFSPQVLYHQLGCLLASPPDLLAFDEKWNLPTTTVQWLAQATALVKATGDLALAVRIDHAVKQLVGTYQTEAHAKDILLVLNQVLAGLELELPASAQGAFITPGASLDAYAALSKIIGGASHSILIVDPYMDVMAVTEVAALAPDGVKVQLLSDAGSVKPTLKPAAYKWVQQYGALRPLEVRLAAARSLHDRLIITDATQAWVLTQSLKDFAMRSPATIQRADADLAGMKIEAFEAIWTAAAPLA